MAEWLEHWKGYSSQHEEDAAQYGDERDAAVARADELAKQVEKLTDMLDRIVNANWWTPLNQRNELDEARRLIGRHTPIPERATAPEGER